MVAVASPSVSFFVHGTPITQGSKRPWHRFNANGNCIVTMSEDNGERLKIWRALVATAAKRKMGTRPPLSGPLKVTAAYFFPRPKSHDARERANPFVSVNGRYDIEKLVRATHDAMTDALLWEDDSQVAVLLTEKRYAVADIPPGVFITVEQLETDEDPLFEGPAS